MCLYMQQVSSLTIYWLSECSHNLSSKQETMSTEPTIYNAGPMDCFCLHMFSFIIASGKPKAGMKAKSQKRYCIFVNSAAWLRHSKAHFHTPS